MSDVCAIASFALYTNDAMEISSARIVANTVKIHCIAHHPALTSFNPTTSFVRRLVEIHPHARELLTIAMSKPIDQILLELAVVVFDAQEVIGLFIADGLRNFRLATHRVNGHDTT